MKKTNFYRSLTAIMLVGLFLLQVSACNTAIAQNTKIREVSSFNALNLAICANVVLKQGSTQKLEIVASDKFLSKIETEVKEGVLTIKWSERNVSCSEKITVYITMVEVKGLRISGSGDIEAADKISAANIDLAISGSGSIKLDNLVATDITSSISGSADIIIGGSSQANKLDAKISGSGNIKAVDVPVSDVSVTLSGSGDCSVKAINSLNIRISGSGNVYYSGTATIDAKVAGSGNVSHVN